MCFREAGAGGRRPYYQWRSRITRAAALAPESSRYLGWLGRDGFSQAPSPVGSTHTPGLKWNLAQQLGQTLVSRWGSWIVQLAWVEIRMDFTNGIITNYKFHSRLLRMDYGISRERERSQKALCLCLVVFPALENYVLIIPYSSSWGTVWSGSNNILVRYYKKSSYSN